MSIELWDRCLQSLQNEFPSQQYNTWIRPLQAETTDTALILIAPNRFVRDWVNDKFLSRITQVVCDVANDAGLVVRIEVRQVAGAAPLSMPVVQQRIRPSPRVSVNQNIQRQHNDPVPVPAPIARNYNEPAPQLELDVGNYGRSSRVVDVEGGLRHQSNLNEAFTFNSFVGGKSNQLALAAAQQVSDNPGGSYNPLFIYGGVGLGKTHLMHAVGMELLKKNPSARIVYLHSERFVADMVKALQLNAINDFKRYYRSVDALLIDDIQFFAGKERSQEEFFHTFNALLEGGQQMILTSDRYPKEIAGVEDRLKSRFGWGLTVAVEPPELETRVAIVMKKAQEAGVMLPR